MEANELRAEAPAKVNLGLAVLTRRGDGFHELETLMARLELSDEVRLSVTPEPSAEDTPRIRLSVVGASGTGGGSHEWDDWSAVPTDGRNLAHRAADAYLGAYDVAQGLAPGSGPAVRIDLVKRIPVAAGLGGGSSDAAAVLRLLARALPYAAGQAELAEMALALGSDVPFFLADDPVAVGRGRGERLTPFALPQLHLVLVNPRFPISAAEAYEELVGFTPRLRPERALERYLNGTDPGWSNGLQPGVLRRYPELRAVLSALRAAGLKGVVMSGSGPTCFGIAADAEEASAVADALAAAHEGWWVSATRTVASGSEVASAG